MVLSFAFAATLLAAPVNDASTIQWVHDDWATAKKQAAKSGQLIAVDVWATWCHTCLSMKNFVLTQKPMAKVAKQHVYLSLDYDKEKNADFFATYPVNVFPTFLVVDPKSDTVVARWAGSGTAKEMAAFFESADPAKNDVTTLVQRLNAAGKYDESIAMIEAALAKAKTPDAKAALLAPYVEAMWKSDPKACATKGAAYVDTVANNAPGIDFIAMVAYCAQSLDEVARRPIMEKVVARLRPMAENPPALAVDDVSAMFGTLVETYDELGKKAEADALAKRRLALLERAAKDAKSPQARATFDYHLVEIYLRFGMHDKAIGMLTKSEAAQPKDFNHPWRLALVYLDRGDTKKGLAAIDRALVNGYGARRLRLHTTKIDLLLKANDVAGAKKQLATARAELDKMKAAQVRKGWVEMLESRATKIDKASQTKSQG